MTGMTLLGGTYAYEGDIKNFNGTDYKVVGNDAERARVVEFAKNKATLLNSVMSARRSVRLKELSMRRVLFGRKMIFLLTTSLFLMRETRFIMLCSITGHQVIRLLRRLPILPVLELMHLTSLM